MPVCLMAKFTCLVSVRKFSVPFLPDFQCKSAMGNTKKKTGKGRIVHGAVNKISTKRLSNPSKPLMSALISVITFSV